MKELSLNILDIIQNSVRAKASEILLEIEESVKNDLYRIIISDNGIGIPADILNNVTDPFVTTRTKRRMGLGLSLLKYHAELTGGGLTINSVPGKGTIVEAFLSFSHIDRQPLGDITGVLILMLASDTELAFIYKHRTDKGEYIFSTKEAKENLEVDTLNERILLEQIGCMIIENLKEIEASGVDFKERIKKIL